MGMNIGIGLEFMLDEVAPSVRPGDVVLVAPEYPTFQKAYRGEPEYIARLVECRPSILASLPFHQVKALMDRGYPLHLGRVIRVVLGIGASDRTLDSHVNAYNHRGAFNANGDIIAHHGVTTARLASPRFELTSPETAELAIRHLNRFHASCLLNGARVYYSHPPCDRSYFASFGAQIEALEILLRARLTIPIVDTPEEMTFSESEIFDLGYHLNLKGKTARSRFLAARLREFMPGETPLTVPRVP
jgi:hypothetical protein